MDALQTILGTQVQAIPPSDGTDLYEGFLEHAKEHRFQVDNSSLTELHNLEERSKAIEQAIEEKIPPLQSYFSGLNDKFKSLTRDLSLIRGKSLELNKLSQENSKDLAGISPLVNDLIISPEVVSQITRGKINASWVENAAYIKDKQEIYAKYKEENWEVPSDFAKLSELLDVLQSLVLERSKKFIVSRIKILRDHRTVPSQRIQSQLLEVKEIFQYLVKHNYSLALELRQAYAYTMRWYYKQYFSRYMRSLTILQYVSIDSNYALGRGLSNSATASGRFASYFSGGYKSSMIGSSNPSDAAINDYFQIEKRLSVLTQEDNTVMVSQIAENNNAPNFLEVGFKNLNLAILDNCSVEFTFLNDFFQVSNNVEDLRGILEQIFQPTFEDAMAYTKRLVTPTFDMFGVLISIWISHHLQFESQRRKVPVVDEYLDGQLILLWPKFQQLVDFQCESLRNFPISVHAKTHSARKEEPDPSTTIQDLTVQFANFLNSILMLSMTQKEHIDERSEPLYNSVIRIRNDFETVMTKCSKKTNHPERFLATNYTYLLNALQQNYVSRERQQHDDTAFKPSLIFQETKTHLEALVEAFSSIT
ncbi:Vps52p [Lachancea thermotolerans CBS 6340]|uniref:KLTH0C09878p n=1 Tax=Lachancea thermotolerans (strain ATCC 56472 / CBS 6340 / NRRL Y-8284) TaxID=559295 RepID=C5DEJ9_LACTC|nr:KLTH0C09878p [Lachancea thermotolerans CBS 6340]CAR22210.1 KLTH0C09878p [Lachancea thermotolerans CBS 6340]